MQQSFVIHVIKIILALLFLLSASIMNAAEMPLFETMQRYHPEVGKHGAVATQESNATKVGLDILKHGGNAIDAAVAIGYALAVTLPQAGNLGGGGIMTIWNNKEKKAYIINYREKAPSNINVNHIQTLYKTKKDDFIYSHKAAGVPGTVAGLNLAATKFGTKKISELIQPAIDLANNGFEIKIGYINSLKFSESRLKSDPEVSKIFFADKNIYNLNYKIKQKDLAHTLKLISQNGNKGFYEGETADLIVKAMSNNAGYMTHQDLENYQAKFIKPIEISYKNNKIYAPPPPSAGGILLAQQLNIIKTLTTSPEQTKNNCFKENNSAKYFHCLAEIMNITYKDRNQYLGDPNFISVDLKKLTSQDYINTLVKQINTSVHTKHINNTYIKEGTNTTHFVVIDKDLNVVSNTYTLNTSFGNHKIIPGTGFFMNNELDDFTILTDNPNVYGLTQGDNNLIAPKKQPLSSMTPIIVIDNNNIPLLATGTPGGSRIPTTTLQVLLNTINYNQDIATAMSVPRIHSQFSPDVLYYEDGISRDTLDKLVTMGHQIEKIPAMGSVQTVYYDKNTHYFYSASDSRRAGALATAY